MVVVVRRLDAREYFTVGAPQRMDKTAPRKKIRCAGWCRDGRVLVIQHFFATNGKGEAFAIFFGLHRSLMPQSISWHKCQLEFSFFPCFRVAIQYPPKLVWRARLYLAGFPCPGFAVDLKQSQIRRLGMQCQTVQGYKYRGVFAGMLATFHHNIRNWLFLPKAPGPSTSKRSVGLI